MRKIGIGAEGIIHKQFATIVKQYEFYNQLQCLFWSYNASGEKRTAITGALLKAKGLKTGQADYTFFYNQNNVANILFIEFKAKKGKQSDTQKEFESKFANLTNVDYQVCYSVNDAVELLKKVKIIKNNT